MTVHVSRGGVEVAEPLDFDIPGERVNRLGIEYAYSLLLPEIQVPRAGVEYAARWSPPRNTTVERRAWIFSLHGHVFYVLQTFDQTLICDLTTGQWAKWVTAGHQRWNMYRGVTWRGRIIAAGSAGPEVWEVDPKEPLDEGLHPIRRVVTGFLPVRGDHSYRQGELRLNASVGQPVAEGVDLEMRFSDDGGHTWVGPFSIRLLQGVYSQELSFRSLGRLQVPGRIWEITDAGGLMRIDDADSELDPF